MKTTTPKALQKRLSAVAILATSIVAFFILEPQLPYQQAQTKSSSTGLTSGQDEGIIAQVEDIFSTSARHVFDQNYWVANMHHIHNPQF